MNRAAYVLCSISHSLKHRWEFEHSRVDQIERNFSAGTAGGGDFARKHGVTEVKLPTHQVVH